MSRIFSIALLAFALVGCSTAPDYTRPNYVAQLPAPIAVEGEPPIITTKAGSQGNWKVYSQTFPDAGTFAVTPPTGAIASLYYSFNGRTQDVPATTVPVLCDISAEGIVYPTLCEAAGELSADQFLGLSLARTSSNGIDFPSFRALPNDREGIMREVPMTLEIPAIPAPQVDLAAGPLVEAGVIEMDLQPYALSAAYPSRALRQEVEGKLLVECQNQSDLSVICTPLSFDPPEHFDLFKLAPRQIFRSVRPAPVLKNGRDARGVRWRSTMAFRIPQ